MPSKLLVQLPSEILAKTRANTVKLDEEFELRDNNRVGAYVEAALRITSTPTGLRFLNSEDPTRAAALAIVKDVSRTGVGVFYHRQLFPQELIEVSFNQRVLTAIVVRCRFVVEDCFEVGGKVLSVKSCRS